MERILYAGGLLTVGEFSLPPTDPRWREINVVEAGPLAVFPVTSAVIQHLGRDAILVNPNHVVYYNAGQRYRRQLHGSDHRCVSVQFTPSLLADVTGGRSELPFDHGPSSADAYLAQHLVVRHLAAGAEPDPLYVEETLSQALGRALGDALELHRIRPRLRPSTQASRHRLVESAKALLIDHATERRSLEFFARAVHTSEFHLARAFRAATGFSLHGYRNHLRLRLALEHLAARDIDLGGLASLLGYASHSHFTDTFRQVFGVAPSEVRDSFGSRGRRELCRVADAALRKRSSGRVGPCSLRGDDDGTIVSTKPATM